MQAHRKGNHPLMPVALGIALLTAAACGPSGAASVGPGPSGGASTMPSRIVDQPGSPAAGSAAAGASAPATTSEALGCETAEDITRQTFVVAPIPSPTVTGGDAGARAAISRGADRLRALHGYRFTVQLGGRDFLQHPGEPSLVDLSMQGSMLHEEGPVIDANFGARMREASGEAAISTGQRIVLGDGHIWGVAEASGVLEPEPDRPGMAADDMAFATQLSPDETAARLLVPFAAGYRRAGVGRHGGVVADHYVLTPAGARAYGTVTAFGGQVAGDLWIASDGGYLIAADVTATANPTPAPSWPTAPDGWFVHLEVTDPNDPGIAIELPVPPSPDPPAAPGPLADLRLTYEVAAAGGGAVSSDELDAFQEALDSRIGQVVQRLTRGDGGAPGTTAITICGSTNPSADKQAITVPGVLTIVPLPAEQYGRGGAPGPRPLPAPGSSIEPSLQALEGVGEVGLAIAHVDPATGRRGVAFHLAYTHGHELFLAHAAAHAGEYVAIVLDGTVLADLELDGLVAEGYFAFTGDYTEASAVRLAGLLRGGPLPFSLREIAAIEIPATRSPATP